MNVYTSDILSGLETFPFVAALITLPYMIYQYRKYGSIPALHTLVVYSFVLYMLIAYFMVILPLPADHNAYVAYAAHPQLQPFHTLQLILATQPLVPSDPSTWIAWLKSPDIYEAFFNVLLLVPLGVYLRYYFRRNFIQTFLIGLSTTLFFELSQLTGLWGLYAHPYRLFDVDDLILNTLGAIVGYLVAGPLLRILPNIRLMNEQARIAGMRASATKRFISFALDCLFYLLFVVVLGAGYLAVFPSEAVFLTQPATDVIAYIQHMPLTALFVISLIGFAVVFVVVPSISKGQTLGQKILHLTTVQSDATPAHAGQYTLRYLTLFAPFFVLLFLLCSPTFPFAATSEASRLAAFVEQHYKQLIICWLICFGIWAISLLIRAVRAKAKNIPFTLISGLVSNTRVMTCAGVEQLRAQAVILDVAQVQALEATIAASGISLETLMRHAGEALAQDVHHNVAEGGRIVIFAGMGNNGGDGWVCGLELARMGYQVTLITPDLAEHIKAQPACDVALSVFSDAARESLPLTILVDPSNQLIVEKLQECDAVVDAMLGTGFSGTKVREPQSTWITLCNARRFAGKRFGRHMRAPNWYSPLRMRRTQDAPYAVAADIPSGLSAQTGTSATPSFAADTTITMLVNKPGLTRKKTQAWIGRLEVDSLIDLSPFLEESHAQNED